MLNKECFVFNNNYAKKWIYGGGGGKDFILYPTGIVCQEVYFNLSKCGLNIIGFGDKDPTKIGKSLYNLPIYSIEEIVNKHENAYLIISSRRYYEEIFMQFLNMGFNPKHLIQVDFSMFDQDFDQEIYLLEHFEQYNKVYKWLEDEESRKIFISLINYRMTFDLKFIKNLQSKDQQYFDKSLIHFQSNEIFVDCGGYIGDTFSVFYNLCPEYKKYYFFEPNYNNMCIAKENIKDKSRIVFINKGVYKKKDLLSFNLSGAESRIDIHNKTKIEVLAMDSILREEAITFIKMDIEGAELYALEGAKEIVKFSKPRLAISVYHHPLDLIKIPILIKTLNPSYKLYLRHYSNSFTETVMYAL